MKGADELLWCPAKPVAWDDLRRIHDQTQHPASLIHALLLLDLHGDLCSDHYGFAWLLRNLCEWLRCPWLTNHMHTGYRGKMEKMYCVLARWVTKSLTDCWSLMQPSWCCGSRLLHLFEYCRVPRKSVPGNAFCMDCVRMRGPWCGHVGTFLGDFCIFGNIFEFRSHFGSVS